MALHGKCFKGRTLRLNFAAFKSAEQMIIYDTKSCISNNNSVHVKFVSTRSSRPRKLIITEELLTNIFEIFGEVVDCAIKESAFDKANNYQYGYAFVHFREISAALSSAGVYSNSHLEHLGY